MQPFVLIHHNGYGWSFMLALIIGLVVSSVFTGLSVGLPLGLVCCTSGKQQINFTSVNVQKKGN